MITSLRLKDFKNFANETLRVGKFTLIVGANASGKSNILDAFRFLHGVGRGYSLAQIAGGKDEAGWKPIRGATNELVRFQTSGANSEVDRFSLEVELAAPNPPMSRIALGGENAKYRIDVRAKSSGDGGLSITDESLSIDSEEIYSATTFEDQKTLLEEDQRIFQGLPLDHSRPALTQAYRLTDLLDADSPAPQDFDEHLAWHVRREQRARSMAEVARQLSWVRFFDFNPDRMREPAFPGQTTLGDSGEYLPVVLREICADPKRESVLTSWLRGLTPMDVESFEFPADPSGRIHLVIRETNGARISASCASDRTLRFLAMLAALLGDKESRVYFFEEIENGLHASRLHLLIDLIERVTSDGNKQVIATTHSAELLSLMADSTFESTSVVCRLEEENKTVIRPLAELHNARKLRKTHGLGRLLAGRWMETAIAFTEDKDDNEEHSK